MGSKILAHRYGDESEKGPWFRRLVRRSEERACRAAQSECDEAAPRRRPRCPRRRRLRQITDAAVLAGTPVLNAGTRTGRQRADLCTCVLRPLFPRWDAVLLYSCLCPQVAASQGPLRPSGMGSGSVVFCLFRLVITDAMWTGSSR
jgi:hypothetical protein